VVVIASPDGRVVAEADGVCDGLIGFERKGTGGFGYDPLFVVPQFGRTMAELTPEEKDAVSHRGRAARALRDDLRRAEEAERRMRGPLAGLLRGRAALRREERE